MFAIQATGRHFQHASKLCFPGSILLVVMIHHFFEECIHDRPLVRVARVLVDDWARILHRPPTASLVELGTGVLWVSTGTHPWDPPPTQDGGGLPCLLRKTC